jgi:hypothetical protein
MHCGSNAGAADLLSCSPHLFFLLLENRLLFAGFRRLLSMIIHGAALQFCFFAVCVCVCECVCVCVSCACEYLGDPLCVLAVIRSLKCSAQRIDMPCYR